MLSTIGLSVGYDHEAILEDINIVFKSNMVYALAAPNGYGKSTFLYALAGDSSCVLRGAVFVVRTPFDKAQD